MKQSRDRHVYKNKNRAQDVRKQTEYEAMDEYGDVNLCDEILASRDGCYEYDFQYPSELYHNVSFLCISNV